MRAREPERNKLAVFAVFWILGLAAASVVSAQEASLTIVDDEELASASRLQFLGDRRVRLGSWPDERRGIEAADAVRNADNTGLVAWTEPGATSEETLLFVVGPAPGRAILQVVRLLAPPGPDRTRALAIKLREVVDSLEQQEESSTNLLGETRSHAARSSEETSERGEGTHELSPSPVSLVGVTAARIEFWLPSGDAPFHARVGGRLGLRIEWFEASLGLIWAPTVALLDEPNRQVRVMAFSPLLNVSAVAPVGRFRFGGGLELRLRTLVFSGGVSPDASSESVFSPGLLALLHAEFGEFGIVPGLAFRLSPGLAWLPVQEHVRLDGARVSSLPRISAVLATEISFVF